MRRCINKFFKDRAFLAPVGLRKRNLEIIWLIVSAAQQHIAEIDLTVNETLIVQGRDCIDDYASALHKFFFKEERNPAFLHELLKTTMLVEVMNGENAFISCDELSVR